MILNPNEVVGSASIYFMKMWLQMINWKSEIEQIYAFR